MIVHYQEGADKETKRRDRGARDNAGYALREHKGVDPLVFASTVLSLDRRLRYNPLNQRRINLLQLQ